MMTSFVRAMAVYCGLVLSRLEFADGTLCPLGCLCSTTSGHVSCENAGLTEVPRVGIGPSVTSLDLAGNHLMMLNSGSLSALRNVVKLKLGNNEIDKILDRSFASAVSLQTLDLSFNNLTVVREHTFDGAHMLTNLDLSHNKLTSVDGAFAGLKELSRLDLRSNKLTEISQFTFRDQVNLRYLLLSDNNVAHIDRRAFRNLEKLTYLVLRQNPISSVERFHFNSLFLSYIDLSECGLTSVPRGLPVSIRYLQLRRNNISVVHRTSFRDCAYVSILVLDENSIAEIESGAFEGMQYLQQLWLNHNNLRRFAVRLPTSVQRLLIESNSLLELSRDVFPLDSQLAALSLAGNNLAELPAASLSRLVKLRSLDVSVNNIRRIYAGTFSNNTRLNSLQLSRNPLEYLYAGSLHGLSSLHQLGMAFVPSVHTFIADDVFRDLDELTILDMDSSPALVRSVLASDSLMSSLPVLHELGILNSHLSRLRSDFPTWFPHLIVVRLSSSRWHCDADSAAWLRGWISSTGVEVIGAGEIRCLTPTELRGRSVLTLAEWELQQHGGSRHQTTLANEITTSSFQSRVRTVIASSKNFSEFYWRQRLRPAGGGQFDHRHRWSASDENLTSFSSKSAPMLPLDNDDDNEQNEYDFVERSDRVPQVGHQNGGTRWNVEGVNSSQRDPSSTTSISSMVTSTMRPAPTATYITNTLRVIPVERRRQLDLRPTVATPVYRAPQPDALSPSSMPSSASGNGYPSTLVFVTLMVTLFLTIIVVVAVVVVIVPIATTSKSRRQTKSSQERQQNQPSVECSVKNHADNQLGSLARDRFLDGSPQLCDNGTTMGSPIHQDAEKRGKKLQFHCSPKTSTIDRHQSHARKNYRPVDDVTVVMTSLVSSTNGDGSAEALSLIPGRDINHEGPHLVYQWTDF